MGRVNLNIDAIERHARDSIKLNKFTLNDPQLTLDLIGEIRKLQKILNMREEVLWFAEQMEARLKENDYKGGWQDCNWHYLLARLQDEVDELIDIAPGSHLNEEDAIKCISESADVANFAMMIADNASEALKQEKI